MSMENSSYEWLINLFLVCDGLEMLLMAWLRVIDFTESVERIELGTDAMMYFHCSSTGDVCVYEGAS